jgi:hypothetical protein
MMVSRIRLALLGAGLLVLIVLWNAPARLLGFWLPAGVIAAQGYQGSIWKGSVSRSAIAVGEGQFVLGQVRWRLSPLSLLRFSPRINLRTRWGAQSVNAEVTINGDGDFDLRQFSADFPAALAQQWLPVQFGGSVNLLLPELEWSDLRAQSGNGRLVWQAAGWVSQGGLQVLGDYALEFAVGDDGILRGEVITLAGDLKMAGDVALDGRKYTTDLLLTSDQALPRELRAALELMASPTASGYHLKLDSEL